MWLALVGVASAWGLGEARELPIRWCVEAREGWDPQIARDAWETWAAFGACTDLRIEEDCAAPDVVVKLGDPDDELDEGALSTRVGDDYVFNDDVDWGDGEACEDAPRLDALLLHELGHAVGLAHSCEDGQLCDDAERDAVMYWALSACDAPSPNLDDFEALAALYGLAGFLPAEDVTVAVGETYCLDAVGDVATLEIAVDWGDGTRDAEVCHAYAQDGVYAVSLAYAWPIECGDYARVHDPYVTVTVGDGEADGLPWEPGPEDTGAGEGDEPCGCGSGAVGPSSLALVFLARRRRG